MILQTDWPLLQLTARQFFEDLLVERLGARAVVEGENFAFGHDREGNVATLAALGREANVRVTIVPPLVHEGVLVSSSRVRDALTRETWPPP